MKNYVTDIKEATANNNTMSQIKEILRNPRIKQQNELF